MMENILIPLKDTMHIISSGLLIPTITILLFFLGLTLVELGGLITEILTERRKMKVNVSELIDVFQKGSTDEIKERVEQSHLFRRQKAALNELIRHSNLSVVSLQALARRITRAFGRRVDGYKIRILRKLLLGRPSHIFIRFDPIHKASSLKQQLAEFARAGADIRYNAAFLKSDL